MYWYVGGTGNIWFIGPTLGGASGAMYWTNDVALPELSPKPTLVKAGNSAGAFVDDQINIIISCPINNGLSLNANECRCGSKTCDADEYCTEVHNKCSGIAACTTDDGSTVNSQSCTCGSNDCSEEDNGQFCLASANKCAREKITFCPSNDGSIINSDNCWCGANQCTSSTGRYCLARLGLCTSESMPGDLTFSGSKIQPKFMGLYKWQGLSLTNGKATYKYLNQFLYWNSEFSAWVIGAVLGSKQASMYWKEEVARPEFSKSDPVVIKTAPASGDWQDENIRIVSSKDCAISNGLSANVRDCTCGGMDCDSTTGYFCLESKSKCATEKIVVCAVTNGASINSANCLCGNNLCDNDKGLFCIVANDKCQKKPVCSKTNGLLVNSNDCSCGTTVCTASLGQYCMSSLNSCLTTAPGDITLSGSTFGPQYMGIYKFSGTNSGGKPSYKFGTNYLYWLSSISVPKWCVGFTLGETTCQFIWSDTDSARPELSPNAKSIRIRDKANVVQDDKIVITQSGNNAFIVTSGLCSTNVGILIEESDCDYAAEMLTLPDKSAEVYAGTLKLPYGCIQSKAGGETEALWTTGLKGSNTDDPPCTAVHRCICKPIPVCDPSFSCPVNADGNLELVRASGRCVSISGTGICNGKKCARKDNCFSNQCLDIDGNLLTESSPGQGTCVSSTPDACTPTQVANSDKSTTGAITGTIGSSKTVTCNTGYDGTKIFTATCGTGGTFNSITCAAKTCAATEVTNSDRSTVGAITGTTGSTTTVTCVTGFKGGGTATCGTNGVFNTLICSASDCKIISVENSNKAADNSIFGTLLLASIFFFSYFFSLSYFFFF